MKLIFSFLCILSICSCINKENTNYQVTIQVTLPEGYSFVPEEKIQVQLTNTTTGTVYTTLCSDTGKAFFDVEYGFYNATAQYKTQSDFRIHLFNGRTESISLLPGTQQTVVPLNLIHTETNPLIIKEIYYAGCKGNKGVNYTKDQYITLYNNSNETIWLDSLCIGLIAPIGNTVSSWMQQSTMELIPVHTMVWQFPGTGKQHALLPGTETTIATNAVDHTGGDYQHVNSVNLSKVNWAFWDQSLSERHDITPGVTPLRPIWQDQKVVMYTLALSGPALILFYIKDLPAEIFAANPANSQSEPGNTNSTKRYLMIPREWVLDCIDCVENADKTGNKRAPAALDNGVAFITGGRYPGKSLIRKQESVTDGQIIYQDTNNSSKDMEESVPALKTK